MLHAIRVVLWGEPPASKEERRLLAKIDWAVLSFTCLCYWSNYVNRANFANAYVSGMRQDLGFVGNEYSIVNTVFTVGYIIGQIPNNLILQVVPAHLWLPLMAFMWGGLSACTAAAKTPQHVMVIRFFQAIMESSTFSGTHYILGSWYKEDEIGKRSAIFASSAQMGSLFSGVMQGSILQSLQGYRGLAAWQWLFLLDFFIAIPIALYGFLCFPGTPLKSRGSWFLSDAERALAVKRLPPRPHTKLDWTLVRRCLKTWKWYAFSALFAISSMLEVVGSTGLFQLWLAAYPDTYSKQDRDFYPLGTTAVAITATFISAWTTDFTQVRWPVNIAMSTALLFTSIVLLVWDVPQALKFFAWTISGVGYAGQATNFVWCNLLTRDDDQVRAVTLASMNLWSNVMQAWFPLVFFPSNLAPRFHRGWYALIVIAILTVVIAYGVRRMELREEKARLTHIDNAEAAEKSPEKAIESSSDGLVDGKRCEDHDVVSLEK